MLSKNLKPFRSGVAAALLYFSLPGNEAVILFHSGDPDQNTSAPAGELAGSGWELQGTWRGFLGTPVAPRYFITAQHVGGSVGDAFVFRGISYTTTARFADSASDLVLWRVAAAFPDFASLYTLNNENGKNVVVFGRGTQRGNPVEVAGLLGTVEKGWKWGVSDGRMRWGENQVDAVVSASGIGVQLPGTTSSSAELLKLGFSSNGGPNEAHLSTGDSGGGLFIHDGTGWKLAGINYAVDGPYNTSSSGTGFFASIHDEGGLYKGGEGNWKVVPDSPSAQPGNFYATRISARMAWIESVLELPIPEEPPVLEFTTGLGEPFLNETSAQVDTATKTIRTSISTEPRLYRLSASNPLRIIRTLRDQDTLVLYYE